MISRGAPGKWPVAEIADPWHALSGGVLLLSAIFGTGYVVRFLG